MAIKFMSILSIEAALAAVRNNGYALQFVPEELRTADVVLEAVRNNGYALKFVLDVDLFKSIALQLGIEVEV